jgi:hypothetical protein
MVSPESSSANQTLRAPKLRRGRGHQLSIVSPKLSVPETNHGGAPRLGPDSPVIDRRASAYQHMKTLLMVTVNVPVAVAPRLSLTV